MKALTSAMTSRGVRLVEHLVAGAVVGVLFERRSVQPLDADPRALDRHELIVDAVHPQQREVTDRTIGDRSP